MSVTNEEVSGPVTHRIAESGGTTSTPLPSRQNAAASSALGSLSSSTGTPVTNGIPSLFDDVVKSGYLRKLKGKKKFFVLRKETDADKPARLEYYANEKKFRMGHPPRKYVSFILHSLVIMSFIWFSHFLKTHYVISSCLMNIIKFQVGEYFSHYFYVLSFICGMKENSRND